MASHAENVKSTLASGPSSSRQLVEILGISQPTASRILASLGQEILRVGSGRSIHYALRDRARGLEDIPVYRVSAEGTLRCLGHLVPAHPGPDAFVFIQGDGVSSFFDGLPWWMDDMRPQGFLGRAYAARYAGSLGLPDNCRLWSGSQVLRALLAHGHDVTGNLLLGDYARERFLTMPSPTPVDYQDFPQWAQAAASGDDPGSSAAGKQPKFVAYTHTPEGLGHAIIKFCGSGNEIHQRWRDLLLAEHLALETLRDHGYPAALTHIVDEGEQRFLVAKRFDRKGESGRIAMISLEVLDAEFTGMGRAPWPIITQSLWEGGRITQESIPQVQTLWAFGTLIGNSDMHLGNLSFLSEHGQPHQVAPAYDMSPMALAPSRSGQLPKEIPRPTLHSCVPINVWRQGQLMARDFLDRALGDSRFGSSFPVCLEALEAHLTTAVSMLKRHD